MATPKWFDPRITIGNVITLTVVGAGVLGVFYGLRGDLALLNQRFSFQVVQDEADRRRTDMRLTNIESQRDDLTSRVIRIEEQLKGQDTKLDIIVRSVSRDRGGDRP
jgi:hypothetical protein